MLELEAIVYCCVGCLPPAVVVVALGHGLWCLCRTIRLVLYLEASDVLCSRYCISEQGLLETSGKTNKQLRSKLTGD